MIERKIDKRGRPYYTGAGRGNPYSKEARKAFFSQFSTRQELTANNAKYKELTTGEKLSFSASNRIRDENGRVISKQEAKAVKFALSSVGVEPTQENINKLFEKQTLKDFLKNHSYETLEVFADSLKLKKFIFKAASKGVEISKSAENIFKTIVDFETVNRIEMKTVIKNNTLFFSNVLVYVDSGSGFEIEEDGSKTPFERT